MRMMVLAISYPVLEYRVLTNPASKPSIRPRIVFGLRPSSELKFEKVEELVVLEELEELMMASIASRTPSIATLFWSRSLLATCRSVGFSAVEGLSPS